ncbi:MAG: formate dehydrogenase subunit delta [Ectothiorhodospiraceae bacterium]|nr:formate dehydrogenase subunit delta [Ectothiorhodospiraceae bacterium]
MAHQRIVAMANQIAAFFAAYPHEEAVACTADHMRQFWDPRMRQALLDHVGVHGRGLVPIALEAARRMAAMDGASPPPTPKTPHSTRSR